MRLMHCLAMAGVSLGAACSTETGYQAPTRAQSEALRTLGDITLHASPTGAGSACTGTMPCDLPTARDRARSLIPTAPNVAIELAGGTYRLAAPLVLGVADSGTPTHPVVYRAAAGEHPVISGARQITGFAKFDDAKNIYRAAVPAGMASRQLFVDGVRASRARGPSNPSGVSVKSTGFSISDASYRSWAHPEQVEVIGNNAWKHMRCPLSTIGASADGGSNLVVDPACWNNNWTNVPNPSFPFNGAGLPVLDRITWIENAFELLGTPGQFYLDSAAGFLYYVPRPGEDLTSADVELPVLERLVVMSGTPGHLAPVNDTDPGISYAGQWGYQSGRSFGDLEADVHFTSTNGDAVTYAFTGTGVQVLAETNTDEGGFDVYIDGQKTSSGTANAASRLAQQAVASISGLAPGNHTIKVVKTGGDFLLVDGFTAVSDAVAPVHDITFSGIGFAYATWLSPSTNGYIDNQAGILWDPTTRKPTRIPAAVQVHRGARIVFDGVTVQHTGTSGIDLADQTQDSVVRNSEISDLSGIGIAVGEVDDYYQTQPALMTSGNTIAENTVRHVGQDYRDAVGIWIGYSRQTTISHNEVGYTPYSGISIGWGWGWTSDCALQAKQGLSTCRHGTTYSGGHQITANHVHGSMGELFDGGPIYTLSGQAQTSEFTGNVLAECNNGCNMIYHDEGSSLWNTHDNVTSFGNGALWLNLWTPSIHDDTILRNYADTARFNNNGTNVSVEQATVVTDGRWPDAARSIIAAAGPAASNGPVADDDNLRLSYTGTSWNFSTGRGDGDLEDAVHYATANGDSATFTFSGTGATFLTETMTDEGDVGVSVDGGAQVVVSAHADSRHAQQKLYAVDGLAAGPHTMTVTKLNGSYLLVDGFLVR
ncbi:MAG TPA: hypothetical protein VNO21_06440 [Polyangiaceae bacterium]|nr:hypothetical protein [Polyangiaceae bacterium]